MKIISRVVFSASDVISEVKARLEPVIDHLGVKANEQFDKCHIFEDSFFINDEVEIIVRGTASTVCQFMGVYDLSVNLHIGCKFHPKNFNEEAQRLLVVKQPFDVMRCSGTYFIDNSNFDLEAEDILKLLKFERLI